MNPSGGTGSGTGSPLIQHAPRYGCDVDASKAPVQILLAACLVHVADHHDGTFMLGGDIRQPSQLLTHPACAEHIGVLRQIRLQRVEDKKSGVRFLYHFFNPRILQGQRPILVEGGGTYTKALADEGYLVDAVELTPRYVEEMKSLFAGNSKVSVFEGNAKDLSFLNEDAYDIVLLMGPVYSLKDFEERKLACAEALRIAKPGGVVFIAFCMQDAGLIHEIFMSENPAIEITTIGYDRETALVTENTGSSRILDTMMVVDELINAVCQENNADKVCRFSQDGISQIISKSVNSMNEASFKEWIQYLLATAERPDLMGFSDHIVQVLLFH